MENNIRYAIKVNYFKYPYIVDGDGLMMVYTSYEHAFYRSLFFASRRLQINKNETYDVIQIMEET